MVGKSKNRRRAREYFKNFPQLLRLKKNVNRNAELQRTEMEICHVVLIAAGQFYLLSYWMTVGI
jgi:hypothetical protein